MHKPSRADTRCTDAGCTCSSHVSLSNIITLSALIVCTLSAIHVDVGNKGLLPREGYNNVLNLGHIELHMVGISPSDHLISDHLNIVVL